MARALGARATWVGRPGRPPGRVGWGLACPSWALGPVIPYIWILLKNRAQSVKAKLHTWCNPMEISLNMNPSPTRFHIAYRHPQTWSTPLGQLKLYNDNFTPTRSFSHLRTPSMTRTPTPTRIPTSTNTPTRSRRPTMTRRAWIAPRCNPCPFQDSCSNQDSQSKQD